MFKKPPTRHSVRSVSSCDTSDGQASRSLPEISVAARAKHALHCSFVMNALSPKAMEDNVAHPGMPAKKSATHFVSLFPVLHIDFSRTSTDSSCPAQLRARHDSSVS